MASGQCVKFKQGELKHSVLEDSKTRYVEDNVAVSKEDKNLFEKVGIFLSKEGTALFTDRDLIIDPRVERSIAKEFSKEGMDKKKIVLMKLHSLLSANPGIIPMVKQFAIEKIMKRNPLEGRNIKAYIQKGSDFGKINFSKLTMGQLTTIYHKASGSIHSKKDFNRGIIGKVMINLPPAKLKWYEKSGAFHRMYEAVKKYQTNIPQQVNRFLEADIFSGKGRKIGGKEGGMHRVINKVIDLGKRISDSEETREKMQVLFQMYMMDWIRIVKNDDGEYIFEKAREYHATGKKYKASQDRVYYFQEYSALTKDDQEYLQFTQEMFISFFKLAKVAEGINEEARKYFNKEFEKTNEHFIRTVLKALGLEYNLANEKAVVKLFLKEDKTQTIYTKLSKEKKEIIDHLMEIATPYHLVEPFLSQGTDKIGKRKRYWPIIYPKRKMVLYWGQIIINGQRNIEEDTKKLHKLKTTRVEDSREKIKEVALRLKINKAIQERNEAVYKKMLEEPVDQISNTILLPARDTKHAKHITNAIDIRKTRLDSAVYKDYLNNVAGQLERNKLTIEYIESYLQAEDDGVREAITGLYQGRLNSYDAQSDIGPFKATTNSITRAFNKVNIPITPERFNRFMAIASKWITSIYLKGVSTALVNKTAMIQIYIDKGLKEGERARRAVKNKEFEDIINISGILEYRDFFSQGLQDEGGKLGLEGKHVQEIIGAALIYYKEKSLGRDAKKALAKFQKVARGEIEDIPSIKVLKKIGSINREKRIEDFVTKLTRYAIEKEWRVAPQVEKINILKKPSEVYKIWADLQQDLGLTIGSTEAYIRSMAFVSGLFGAMDAGWIEPQSAKQLKNNPEQLKKAIAFGEVAIETMIFGLDKMSVGVMNRGPLGKFFMQFTFWQQQKMVKDINTIHDAYLSVKDLDKTSIDMKAVRKTLGMLLNIFKYPQKALRHINPDVAALRSFTAIQGLIVPIMELFIFGPLTIMGLTKVPILRSIPGLSYLRGIQSDLMSLSLLIPSLAYILATGRPDEDEWERIVRFYSRKTFLGWGAHYTADSILWLLSLLSDDIDERKIERTYRVVDPLIPTSPQIKRELKAATKDLF